MPFVPTPAAFFSAVGGVVIRRTFSAGAGRRGLESAAQFSTGCIVIGGTVCRAASFIQVVILHTIPGSRRWNPPHSLRRARVVIGSTISVRCASQGKKNGCYRAHNSHFFLRAAGCYPQHNLRGGENSAIVIGSTFRNFVCFPNVSGPGCYPAHISGSGVVIGRTVSKL